MAILGQEKRAPHHNLMKCPYCSLANTLIYTTVTFTAAGPFLPCSMSKVT
jgi:hypothetical protein